MPDPLTPPMPDCPDCHGATVTFRGHKWDFQYRICVHYREPGHLTWAEVRQRISAARKADNPSGRLA